MTVSRARTGTHGDVAGVVLAGGRSRRMGGRDKALLELAGGAMVDRVVSRLAAQVPALAVSANGDPSRLVHLGVPILADPVPGFAGPLAGVLAAMHWARELQRRFVVTVPVDTPFVPADLVARLGAGIGDAEVAVASSRGVDHPTVALWRTALTDELDGWLRDDSHRAARAWIATRRSVLVAFADSDGGDPFFNVNTPDDLREAIARAGHVEP